MNLTTIDIVAVVVSLLIIVPVLAIVMSPGDDEEDN